MKTGKSQLMSSLTGAILLSTGRISTPENPHFCLYGLSANWGKFIQIIKILPFIQNQMYLNLDHVYKQSL